MEPIRECYRIEHEAHRAAAICVIRKKRGDVASVLVIEERTCRNSRCACGQTIVISIVKSLFWNPLPNSLIANVVEIAAKSSSRFNNLGF